MAQDYRNKIKKLLALAESPNEHEARAALLKARQLMAEYKLTETELEDVGKQEVKDVQVDITCSKRRNPWIIPLSGIIGENYCCKGYRRHRRREQTQEIGFIGFEKDVEICVAVFKYAVDCILSEIKRIKAENSCYNSKYAKSQCDSYGYGFCVGLQEAFERQQKANEQEWGLVLVTPQEVLEASKNWGREEFKTRAMEDIAPDPYFQGLEDGKAFDMSKRIGKEAMA